MKITIEKLNELKENYSFLKDFQGIKSFVIDWFIEKAPDYYHDYKSLFSDLLRYGCQSGIVSELIYYYDTRAFFDKYSDEIFELLDQDLENFGQEPEIKGGDRKSFYSWYAFERISQMIYDYFEYEDDDCNNEFLNEDQVKQMFFNQELPLIIEQYSKDDIIAINEGFNNFTDGLCKDGEISEDLYNEIYIDDDELDEILKNF